MVSRDQDTGPDRRHLRQMTARAFWIGAGLGLVLGLIAGMVLWL
jgi:Mg/Co/Ni transporter MgtE